MNEELKQLHLYAQQQWHDEAYIVGDEAGLRELINTLQRALDQHSDQKTADDMYAADGEGYTVRICLISSEEFKSFAVPYTDEMAQDKNNSAIWPWTRVHQKQ